MSASSLLPQAKRPRRKLGLLLVVTAAAAALQGAGIALDLLLIY